MFTRNVKILHIQLAFIYFTQMLTECMITFLPIADGHAVGVGVHRI